ncbi:MAG: hypothetical protein NXY57DRAFT_350988 [Lentinula lateritia]|nr:MAG: hypothetical protein NXY57DRAFT_350988 [Lentinula lateritia]
MHSAGGVGVQSSSKWDSRRQSFISPTKLQEIRATTPTHHFTSKPSSPQQEESGSGGSSSAASFDNINNTNTGVNRNAQQTMFAPSSDQAHPRPVNNASNSNSSQNHSRTSSFFSFRHKQQPSSTSSGVGDAGQRVGPVDDGKVMAASRPSTSSGPQQQQPPDVDAPLHPPPTQPSGVPLPPNTGALASTALPNSPSQPPPPPPLHPEIRSVVGLTVAHAHKIYFSGPLIRRVEREPNGSKPHGPPIWEEVWAQLGGTTLSVWNMKEIQEASKLGKEVPPSYINMTDAFVQVLGSVTIPATPAQPAQPAKPASGSNPAVPARPAVPAQAAQRYTNVLTLNTAGSNLILFACPHTQSLISWAAALRLSAWEKSRLEEIYTAHLCRITLSARDIPTTLVRGRLEGWVRIRIAGQTDWKLVWMTVSAGSEGVAGMNGPDELGRISSNNTNNLNNPNNPNSPNSNSNGNNTTANASITSPPSSAGSTITGFTKKRMSALFSRDSSSQGGDQHHHGRPSHRNNSNANEPPMVSMYTSPKPKDRKKPILTLPIVSQAFAVYPERPELISRSTLFKVEATFGTEDGAGSMRGREGWVLIMPQLEGGLSQAAEMLKWVIAFHDTFKLYGRPQAWSWDPRDPASLMFAYPVGPGKDLLFLDREHAESLDPRDDRTSSIRSRLIGILKERMELGGPPGSAGSAGSGAPITPPGASTLGAGPSGAGDRTAQQSSSNNSQARPGSSGNSGPLSLPQLPPLSFDSSSAADDVREERALLTPITERSSVYTASVMRSGTIGTIGSGFGPNGSTGGRNSGYGFQGPSPVLEESDREGTGSVSPKVPEKDFVGMRGMSFSSVGSGGGGRKSVDVPPNVNTTSSTTPASPPPPTRSISPTQGNASGGGTGSPASGMLPHSSFESFSNAVNTALPKSKPMSPSLSPSLSPSSSTMSPPANFPNPQNPATANPSNSSSSSSSDRPMTPPPPIGGGGANFGLGFRSHSPALSHKSHKSHLSQSGVSILTSPFSVADHAPGTPGTPVTPGSLSTPATPSASSGPALSNSNPPGGPSPTRNAGFGDRASILTSPYSPMNSPTTSVAPLGNPSSHPPSYTPSHGDSDAGLYYMDNKDNNNSTTVADYHRHHHRSTLQQQQQYSQQQHAGDNTGNSAGIRRIPTTIQETESADASDSDIRDIRELRDFHDDNFQRHGGSNSHDEQGNGTVNAKSMLGFRSAGDNRGDYNSDTTSQPGSKSTSEDLRRRYEAANSHQSQSQTVITGMQASPVARKGTPMAFMGSSPVAPSIGSPGLENQMNANLATPRSIIGSPTFGSRPLSSSPSLNSPSFGSPLASPPNSSSSAGSTAANRVVLGAERGLGRKPSGARAPQRQQLGFSMSAGHVALPPVGVPEGYDDPAAANSNTASSQPRVSEVSEEQDDLQEQEDQERLETPEEGSSLEDNSVDYQQYQQQREERRQQQLQQTQIPPRHQAYRQQSSTTTATTASSYSAYSTDNNTYNTYSNAGFTAGNTSENNTNDNNVININNAKHAMASQSSSQLHAEDDDVFAVLSYLDVNDPGEDDASGTTNAAKKVEPLSVHRSFANNANNGEEGLPTSNSNLSSPTSSSFQNTSNVSNPQTTNIPGVPSQGSGPQYKSSFAPSKSAAERKAKAQAAQAAQAAAIHRPGGRAATAPGGFGGSKGGGTRKMRAVPNTNKPGSWSSEEEEEEEEEEEDDDDEGDVDSDEAPKVRGETGSKAGSRETEDGQGQFSQLRPPRTLPQIPGRMGEGDQYPAQSGPPRSNYFDDQQLQPPPQLTQQMRSQSQYGLSPPISTPGMGAPRQSMWSQVLDPNHNQGSVPENPHSAPHSFANPIAPTPLPSNTNNPAIGRGGNDLFVQLEPPSTHLTKAFTPQGLLSAGLSDRQDRSAKRQEEMARESGASLINVPNKPPPPQTGLLGAITGYERERKRDGGVGAALTERERERRMVEERQRRWDEQQRMQMEGGMPGMGQMPMGQMGMGGPMSMYGGFPGMNPMMSMYGMNPMMMGGMNPMMTGGMPGGGMMPMNPMMTGGQMGGGLSPMMTGGMNPMMMGGMNPQHMFAAQQAAQAYQQAMMAFSVAGSQAGDDNNPSKNPAATPAAGSSPNLNPMMSGNFDPRMSMMSMGGGMGMGQGMPPGMSQGMGMMGQPTPTSQFDPRFSPSNTPPTNSPTNPESTGPFPPGGLGAGLGQGLGAGLGQRIGGRASNSSSPVRKSSPLARPDNSNNGDGAASKGTS